jgi:hypothetical protein
MENDLQKFVTSTNIDKAQVRENIARISEVRALLYTKYVAGTLDLKTHPFVAEFFQVCEKHLSVSKHYKLLFGKESLVDPLLSLRQKYFGKDDHINQISPFLNDCSSLYKNIENSKTTLMLSLERHKSQYRELYLGISSDLEQLQD